VAMQQQTVLAVQAPNGEVAFTRRGDLRVNINGALETGQGHLVLGNAGGITVPPGFTVRINPDGTVVAANPAQPGLAPEQVVGQLRLRDAGNVNLSRREDGLLELSDQPPGTDITNGTEVPGVVTGMLEGSNVSAIAALTRLIDHARSFELQVKVIKEAKDIDQSGSALLKPA
jgi:flagellar basal-body rod protein FlgF